MRSALSLEVARDCLRAGRLVAIPTETVYGLAANALDDNAVARIFAVKERPQFNPIICHMATIDAVFRYGRETPLARRLSRYWPGPLTILLEHNGRIPGIVTAGSNLAGFRIPDHSLTLELMRELQFPLAAPSANRSGQRSPTDANMVMRQLGDSIAGVLDGGACRIGLESTVVRLIEEQVEILRPGGITLEQLLADGFSAHYFDPGSDPVPVANASPDTLPSPGMLDRHYAPSVPLLFFEHEYAGPNNSADLRELIQQYKLPTGKIGSLYFESLDKAQSNAGINDLSKTIQTLSEYSLELSSKGDLIEAAARLFRLFDTAAEAGLACLLVCAVPDEGLGRAINDRLRRAATFVLR